LLGISTSGKSKNVVNAAIVAKAFGLKSIALTGRSGGDLAPLADVAIKVPSDNVAEIQELHLPVYHWLSTELEEVFFAG
jgi:D-sedoheptulose 7-phosphate isomerase